MRLVQRLANIWRKNVFNQIDTEETTCCEEDMSEAEIMALEDVFRKFLPEYFEKNPLPENSRDEKTATIRSGHKSHRPHSK